MAREIRAIECPKCGSTQKSEIRKDYFRCQNCDTEYFLENDDITITHNVNYTHGTSSHTPVNTTKKAVAILAFTFVALVFIILFIILKFNDRPAAGNGVNIAEVTTYTWWGNDFIGFNGPSNKPVVAIMGQLDISGSNHEEDSGRYIVFYDLLSGKELQKQRLTNIPEATHGEVKLKKFDNGDIYAIANKMLPFKIDKNKLAAQDVTDMFVRHQQLSAGIANIEFVHIDYGDGFNVLTNDGKNYFYYPTIDRIYTKDEYEKAQEALTIRDADAIVKTYYNFSNMSREYPDEPIRLMKYTQKDNAGGPGRQPYFEVTGVYVDNVKQKSMFRWDDKLVLKYEDFTPGRLYFSPEVLYHDDKHVLIKFNNTAAEESNTSLQCLDANTGKILFTLPFNETKYLYKPAVKYNGGFMIKTNIGVIAVSMKGKLIKEFKTI